MRFQSRILMKLVSCLLIVPFSSQGTHADEPPVKIEHIECGGAKKYFDHFLIRIRNPHDRPTWYLFPGSSDELLSKNGIFKNSTDAEMQGSGPGDQPFEASQTIAKNGKIIEVRYTGRTRFSAFLVPPNGYLEYDNWNRHDRCEIREKLESQEILILESRSIRINGKISLEKWLPFEVMSDKDVESRSRYNEDLLMNWDWKNQRPKVAYRKEPVKLVEAEKPQAWMIKFPRNRN